MQCPVKKAIIRKNTIFKEIAVSVKITGISWRDCVLRIDAPCEQISLTKIGGQSRDIAAVFAAKPVCLPERTDEGFLINVVNVDSLLLAEGGYAFFDEEGAPIEADAKVLSDLLSLGRAFVYDGGAYSLVAEMTCAADDASCRTFPILNIRYMRRNKNARRRRPFAEALCAKQALSRIVKYTAQHVFNAYYHVARLFCAHADKTVLFASQNRNDASANLAAIERRMCERGMDKDYRLIHSHHDIFSLGVAGKLKSWLDFLTKAARSDYIFLDDYTPTLNGLKLSKKTQLIQTWHAGFGFKRVGYSRFGLAGGPHAVLSGHRMYTLGLVGCEELKPIFEEVWGIDKSRLLATGLPRLDHFLDEDAAARANERLFEKYPELSGKRFIVFAPTYRGLGHDDAHYDYSKIDFDALYALCEKKDVTCVFKMHPFIAQKPPVPENMRDRLMSVETDINDLYYSAAMLITDYSSCFYEFMLLKKPVLFYVYDEDYYCASRGVQRSLGELAPGPLCHDFDELLTQIDNALEGKVDMSHARFIDKCAERGRMASDIAIDKVFYRR